MSLVVQANGLSFSFLEEGEGPLVLLVHGFPDTAHGWDSIRPTVAKADFVRSSELIRILGSMAAQER